MVLKNNLFNFKVVLNVLILEDNSKREAFFKEANYIEVFSKGDLFWVTPIYLIILEITKVEIYPHYI